MCRKQFEIRSIFITGFANFKLSVETIPKTLTLHYSYKQVVTVLYKDQKFNIGQKYLIAKNSCGKGNLQT